MEIELSVFIAALACIVSFATWLGKTKRESGEKDAQDAKMMTKLDFIGDDIKDIKADQRSFRRDIDDVRAIANHALDRAEAAHSRLDRSGVDCVQHDDDHIR